MSNDNGVKTYEATAERRSVVDLPDVSERQRPSAYPLILHVAQASQNVTPWGVNFKRRDQELRSFWIGEPWLASVVYLVSIRNASFGWEITGSDPSKPHPKNTVRAATRMLNNSAKGKGWQKFITKTCVDLYTTDNGAFWEIIRTKNRPDAPVINLSNLDSLRCWRTGDAEYPVIYQDRYGRERILRWWQVQTLEEFPSPIEEAYDTQYSAVTRVLLAAEILQSIAVYKQEKVGGTFTRAIDVVSGLTDEDIQNAQALAVEQNLNRDLLRYSLPVIIPSINPDTKLSHVHIDIASLPDNFNEDTSYKWYVAQLAAAFGVDYQEIAPLMTGNLGSSQQSEIMHLKTRGKGPALIMSLIEHAINNNRLIPGNVEFKFLEQDLRSDKEKSEARYTRSMDRAMRVKTGELDAEAARQVAIMDGDLPIWLAEEIKERGVAQPMANPAQSQDADTGKNTEFSSNQIEGGMETNMKLTADIVQQMRDKLRFEPDAFMDDYYALDRE